MKVLHSVRTRIIVLTTALMALLLVVYTLTMWVVATRFALTNYSQNTAFSLSVVSNAVEEDLENIDSLTTRVSIDTGLKNVLANFNGQNWTEYYVQFESMIQSSPAYHVIDRFIIMDSTMEHFLQVGNPASMGRPIRQDYMLMELDHVQQEGVFSGIFTSALSYNSYDVIAIVRPIVDYNTGRTLGFVYASVLVDQLLANLYSYQTLNDASIFFIQEGRPWKVEDGSLIPLTLQYATPDKTLYMDMDNADIWELSDGEYILQIDSQENDFSLIQFFDAPSFTGSGQFPAEPLIILIAIIVILVALVLSLYLNKAIYKPVKRLARRIERIQHSDFSQDEGTNTRDEFGIIGRGINKLSSEVTDLMDKRVEDERKKLELEYRMLSSQINPHFLYNTFNSIKWMATIQGADGIGEMVTSLSRLMKNISKRDASTVPLSDELSFIDDYLVIMKYRYGNTISYYRSIDPACSGLMLPRFTLQPLVENAIFHGIEPRGTGAVAIIARSWEDHYTVMVADNGVGFDKTVSQPKGDGVFKNIGVDNIRQRLEYTYPGRVSFSIDSVVGLGTRCFIRIGKEDEVTREL